MTIAMLSQDHDRASEATTAPNQAPQHAEAAIARTLDKETVVLNVDEGHYYVLNETATAIWNLCDGLHTPAEIVAALCCEFDVPHDAAQASIRRLFKDLDGAHLLVWGGSDGAGAGYAAS